MSQGFIVQWILKEGSTYTIESLRHCDGRLAIFHTWKEAKQFTKGLTNPAAGTMAPTITPIEMPS
ncbi:MAG: hypothetical protein ACO3X1_11080 [Burkholderiaceae bacterium]